MKIEEIENDLNRGIYLNNYSNVEQAIKFLLSEVKRLREGIEKIYEYTSPTDTPEIYKKVIELLEGK